MRPVRAVLSSMQKTGTPFNVIAGPDPAIPGVRHEMPGSRPGMTWEWGGHGDTAAGPEAWLPVPGTSPSAPVHGLRVKPGARGLAFGHGRAIRTNACPGPDPGPIRPVRAILSSMQKAGTPFLLHVIAGPDPAISGVRHEMPGSRPGISWGWGGHSDTARAPSQWPPDDGVAPSEPRMNGGFRSGSGAGFYRPPTLLFTRVSKGPLRWVSS